MKERKWKEKQAHQVMAMKGKTHKASKRRKKEEDEEGRKEERV